LTWLSVVGSVRPRYPDILYYNGDKLPLITYELDPLLINELGVDEDELKTSNYYDYVATWEIANEILYLRRIDAPTAWVDMANLFRGYEEGQCVPAAWVSDRMVASRGEVVDYTFWKERIPIYEEACYFWIEDGQLVDSKFLENSGANNEDNYPKEGVASMRRRPPDRPNEDLQYSDDNPSWCSLMDEKSIYNEGSHSNVASQFRQVQELLGFITTYLH
jgi:hypothetical protein